MNVWGLQDSITTSFGAQQYEQRATVAGTIKSWGANLVRFRVLADDYNNAPSAATGGLTQAQIIQRIKDWRNAVVSARHVLHGLFLGRARRRALGRPAGPATAQRVHQLFADIHAALGDDPMVIYEVTNEPNNVGWADWDANMRGSIKYFRDTIGYRGLLVIDPIWWANSGTGGEGYDDGRYSALEAYDAAQPGMGSHQLAFAKHDYASSYRGKAWNAGAWVAAAGRVAGQAPDLRDRVRQLQRRLVDGQRRLVDRRGELLREPLRRPAELRRRRGVPVRRLVGRERAHRGEQREHDDLGIVGSHVPGALTRRQREQLRAGGVGEPLLELLRRPAALADQQLPDVRVVERPEDVGGAGRRRGRGAAPCAACRRSTIARWLS